MPDSAQQSLTATITSLVAGGRGLARVDDFVWFVAGGLPGDLVEFAPTKRKAKFGEGQVTRIVKPSPDRRQAPCAIADRCGGCNWQALPSDKQGEWKQRFIRDAFVRIGRLAEPDVVWHASPSEWNYRNRVLLRGRIHEDGAVRLGFFASGSHDFVAASTCPVLEKPLAALLTKMTATLRVDRGPELRFRLRLQAFYGQDQQPQIAVGLTPERRDRRHQQLVDQLKTWPEVCETVIGGQHTLGVVKEFEQQGTRVFQSRLGLFQQVNRGANHDLRQLVLQLAPQQPGRLLDLYCGSGNLSLPFVDRGWQVHGFESSEAAIALASAQSGPDHDYQALPVAEALTKLQAGPTNFDCVVVDPPRAGMEEAADLLAKLAVPEIVYVSCNPATLARDLKALLADSRLEIAEVHGFDFFPQTDHVETVVHLKQRP